MNASILLNHGGSWMPFPDVDPLGWKLIGYAVTNATWFDWLGVLGLVAFVTRAAFPVDHESPFRVPLDAAATFGCVLTICVIVNWSAR